jgi:hypothetical protein
MNASFQFLINMDLLNVIAVHVLNVCRLSFPVVEGPRLQTDHSPPSKAQVKNEWSYTSAPPICLNYLDREEFISYSVAIEMNLRALRT